MLGAANITGLQPASLHRRAWWLIYSRASLLTRARLRAAPFLLAVAWGIAQPAVRAAEPAAASSSRLRTITKISNSAFTALVDTQDTPDLKDWGVRAGTLCVEWLPKIATLLPSEGFAGPKEVTLHFDPHMKGVAHAAGGKITIAASWVRAHPDDFGMVIHELTHVVQAYPPGGPGWLVEGIADYVRIVHYEPQAPRPRIDPARASHKDAYKTTAMFLEWAEKTRAPGLVARMNTALRQGAYDEVLWQQMSGRTLDELWKLFVQTLPPPP